MLQFLSGLLLTVLFSGLNVPGRPQMTFFDLSLDHLTSLKVI